MSTQCTIAVDIGGTKIAAAYVPADQPTTVLGTTTRPSRAKEGKENILASILAAVDETITAARGAGYEPTLVGLGSPGVVDARTGVINSAGDTMPGWGGTHLTQEVSAHCGLPAYAHNDVRVMGLGEAVYGAGKGLHDVLFVSFGTGIGGAIVTNGELSSSPHGSRGELCYLVCENPLGGVLPMEDVGSGTALTTAYNLRAGLEGENSIDLRAIMQRYHDGEELAHQVLEENLYAVGTCLANFINAIDVEALVIGGGVATIGEPVIDPLTRGVRDHLLPPLKNIPIERAQFLTDAPLIGAAHLAVTAHATTT